MLILWITVLKLGSALSCVAYGYHSQQISVLKTMPMKVFISDYFHTDFYLSSTFQRGKFKSNRKGLLRLVQQLSTWLLLVEIPGNLKIGGIWAPLQADSLGISGGGPGTCV